LIYAIGTIVAAALILAGFDLRERALRRRPLLLAAIMDEADALETELHECRARLREIPALVTTLPPSAQLSARATLVAEPQVQAALRDLLSHRLWLKENATTATMPELESARSALSAAKAALAAQLDRLADVRSELEAARAAQAVRAADAQS
jgi:chaperonin cofactor prefoldin